MKDRILRFHKGPEPKKVDVKGERVHEYVRARLSFPLPEFIYEKIDTIIGDIWNSSGLEIHYDACVEALRGLEKDDIFLPYSRRDEIMRFIFEYLEEEGHITLKE